MHPTFQPTSDLEEMVANKLGEFSSFLVAESPSEADARAKLENLADSLPVEGQQLFRDLADGSLQFDLQLRTKISQTSIESATFAAEAGKDSKVRPAASVWWPVRIATVLALVATIGIAVYFVQHTGFLQDELADIQPRLTKQ